MSLRVNAPSLPLTSGEQQELGEDNQSTIGLKSSPTAAQTSLSTGTSVCSTISAAARSKLTYGILIGVFTLVLLEFMVSSSRTCATPLHQKAAKTSAGNLATAAATTTVRKLTNGTSPVLGPVISSLFQLANRVHIAGPVPQRKYDRDFCADVKEMENALHPTEKDPVRWGEREPGYRHLVIVSTGGVGTTYFMNGLKTALAQYGWKVNRPSNAPSDSFWKHRYPAAGDVHLNQLGCWGADRIIYLFNDPVAQFQSLFRREFIGALKGFAGWDRSNAHAEAFDDLDTYIDAVLTYNRDLAGIQQHMMAWMVNPAPCPILVADTRTILQNMDIVARYLSVPEKSVSHLVWSTRSSSQMGENSQFPPQFLELYANAYAQMSTFDMTLIVPANYKDPIDLRSVRPASFKNVTEDESDE